MKKLAFFSMASLLFVFVGCDNLDNVGGADELVVKGRIAGADATKVDFSYGVDAEGEYLAQIWEVGDHIIGSYGSGSDIVDVDYKVKSVESDGTAIFEKVGDFASPVKGTTVHVICLGQKDNDYQKTEDGSLTGNMYNQYKTVMTASATVADDELEFEFVNRVAVLGVDQIYMPNVVYYEGTTVTYSGVPTIKYAIQLTNVDMATQFMFSNGEFAFTNYSSDFYSTGDISLSERKSSGVDFGTFGGFYTTIFPAVPNYGASPTIALYTSFPTDKDYTAYSAGLIFSGYETIIPGDFLHKEVVQINSEFQTSLPFKFN